MTEKIGDVLDGYEEMRVRQSGGHNYRVVSWRSGQPRVHKVNIDELTCTCEDYEYNQDHPDVCDHLAKAVEQAPKHLSVDETAPYYLFQALQTAEDAAETAEDVANNLDGALIQARDASAAAAAADADGAESDTSNEEEVAVDDPVAAFQDALVAVGLNPQKFEVWVDDEYESVQATTDAYLEDDEFEQWREFKEELGMRYDGDNDRSYLPPDEFGVLA